ncbi:tetratricopeptide repeat protein [Kibdelosporangium aridum]|uniref:Tetratricopeptide repeat protein n=1 Tax=Kibdelosporangium aridum TaxID=2030 RepID=A0A428Z4N5_KIBAR|nr:tetratricopeptide repeat protein [Kibdelosporangium aridum]RSM81596.1 tetratricopeptide repeat protein [Kibdelosporangium aridum]
MQLVALVSDRCFHCVEYDVFAGSEQTLDRILSLVGTVCPLCPETIEQGDLSVVMDEGDLDRIKQGTSMWNRDPGTAPGYAGFFGATPKTHTSGSAAEKLRRSLGHAEQAQRKQRCIAATKATLGVTASHAREAEKAGDRARARKAYQVIVDYGEATPASSAAMKAGWLAQEDDDMSDAIRLFELAATKAVDPKVKAIALACLGGAYDHIGRTEHAIRAFRDCVAVGPTSSQPESAYRLGNLLMATDPPAAREAFALAVRDAEYGAPAALNLGVIEEDAGNMADAERWFDQAFAQGDVLIRTVAAFNLGRVWEARGQLVEARRFYRVALDSPVREAARRARAALDRLG